MGMAVVVIANDFSAINVALPTMEKDFDTNINTIQWVVNAYALTFGVMIVTGGRLADMFGRRNAFFLGTAIFASMSALGGAAQTETWLIATRTLMGIGGALMWPAILGMTFAILPEEKAGLAGGIILGAAGLGNAIGPLIEAGLADMIAESPAQYVQIADGLTRNPGWLKEMRASLRDRIAGSSLMDEKRFARNMEAAFRAMWRNHCAGRKDELRVE